jgi:hypothetical protein
VAISADDRRNEPLAIKAAIRRMESRPGEQLMADLSSLGLEPFGLLVDHYFKIVRNGGASAPAQNAGKSPMRNAARRRPPGAAISIAASAAELSPGKRLAFSVDRSSDEITQDSVGTLASDISKAA